MVLRKCFYISWSAGRSPRVHEVNPGWDPSKTHIFLSPFFKFISGLKVQFNAKLWSFHPDFCFAGT